MPLPPLTGSTSAPSLGSRLDEKRRQRLHQLLTKAQRGADFPPDAPASQCGSQAPSCRRCGGSKAPSSSSRDKHGPGNSAAAKAQAMRKVESLPNLPPVKETLPPIKELQAATGPEAKAERRGDKRRNDPPTGQVEQGQGKGTEQKPSRGRRPKERGTFYDNVLSESSFKQAPPSPDRNPSKNKRYSPRTQRAGEYVRGLIKGTGGPNEWRLHEELEAVDHLLDEDASKHKEAEKLRQYREGLKKQSEDLTKSKADQRQAYVDWGRQIYDDAERYRAEEEQKKQDRLLFEKRFNEERAAQYQDIMNRRQKAQDEDDRLDRDMVARAVKAKRDEEERDAARKRHQREQQEKIAAEALESMKRREEEAGVERQNDIRLMREQKELLDKQERDRAAYFENLKQKQLQKQAAYAAGAGNELARKQAEDEDRARKEQMKELERVRKDQEDRDSRKRKLQQEGFDAVKLQLQAHADAKERQRNEDLKFGQLFRQEAKQALDDEKEKERQRRLKEQENAAFLKKQMDEKSQVIPGKYGHTRMNEVERSMNKAKVDRALDPQRPDGLQLLFRQKQLQYQHGGVPQ